MTNVTTLSIEFDVLLLKTDVFTARTLEGGSNEILLPKLDTISVQPLPTYGQNASTIAALVKMAALRSPSDAGASGVTPLREVHLSTTDDLTTLRADPNAALERWGYKIAMPRITCDYLKQRCRHTFLSCGAARPIRHE